MHNDLKFEDVRFVFYYITLLSSSRKHLSHGITVYPNQSLISMDSLSRSLNIHISKLNKLLAYLEEINKIKIEHYDDFMVISIIEFKL